LENDEIAETTMLKLMLERRLALAQQRPVFCHPAI